jgi:hypothetical protein
MLQGVNECILVFPCPRMSKRITKCLESIDRQWRSIEEVEESLHVRTPIGHGGREWKGEEK